MKTLYQLWYRWFDPELHTVPLFPDREGMTRGEWNALIGGTGERLAAKELRRTGRKVLYRNFRPEEGGEVDIVYRDKDILVFGEVKTRSQGEFGGPARAVDREKQKLIIRGANAWLRELNHPEILFRFDVIEILLHSGAIPQIRVNEGAFTTPQTGLGM
ncbi:MAG: YraN family protein [Verrucomicrobiales bacterium]|nr:YraN family protein [Verrucomicrobiales bacterium]MBP9225001.1 YraN family protein [Verrucomicrobiales bacterium]HQZ27201.1 YraN family protein [Verrucomicrobiales bacterium]